MASERLEGAQGVQRWKVAAGHVKKPHRRLTDKSLSGDAQSGDKAGMPFPSRITPLQILALLAIWAAAIHGLLRPTTGPDVRSAAAKAPPNVACAKPFRES
jgi:hypothetical protein